MTENIQNANLQKQIPNAKYVPGILVYILGVGQSFDEETLAQKLEEAKNIADYLNSKGIETYYPKLDASAWSHGDSQTRNTLYKEHIQVMKKATDVFLMRGVAKGTYTSMAKVAAELEEKTIWYPCDMDSIIEKYAPEEAKLGLHRMCIL